MSMSIAVEGNEAVVRTARSIFPLAEKANDESTADLLTQRMSLHEKMLGCYVVFYKSG